MYVGKKLEKYKEFATVSKQITSRKGMKSRFMSIGFSREHKASFMNEIAGFGTEKGNFIFVDSEQDNFEVEI